MQQPARTPDQDPAEPYAVTIDTSDIRFPMPSTPLKGEHRHPPQDSIDDAYRSHEVRKKRWAAEAYEPNALGKAVQWTRQKVKDALEFIGIL